MLTGLDLTFMGLTQSNSGLFSTPGSIVSPVGKRERGGGVNETGRRKNGNGKAKEGRKKE